MDAAPNVEAEVTAVDAGAPVADAGAPRPPPKKVLHAGDSFVGGHGGLTRALEARFASGETTFVRDWWTSITVEGYARTKRLDELLKEHDPDLVILTLGANDMYVPVPQSLAPFVRAIVKKIGARECYWITPIQWTKAKPTGIVQVIKENAAPCKVFEGDGLKLDLAGDHVHPSNHGGEQWADAFFSFYLHAREARL